MQFNSRITAVFLISCLLICSLIAVAVHDNEAVAKNSYGFVLASAGADGIFGTNDDIYATEKTDAVKGTPTVEAEQLLNGCVYSNTKVNNNAEPEPQSEPRQPQPALVELLVNPQVATIGQVVTVTAVVKDSNNQLLPNIEVSFITNLGTISPQVAVTNSEGIATVTLTSNETGQVTVTATAGSISGSTTIVFTIMQGYFIPDGTVVTASGTYGAYVPNKAMDRKIEVESRWLAPSWSGWICFNFPTPQTISAVQISAHAYPATNEVYTIYGYQNGKWIQISSPATRYVYEIKANNSNISQSILLPIPVTKGTYDAIKIDVNGGSSWVAIIEVTLIP